MTQPPYLTIDPRPLIMQMDGGRWRAVGLEEGFGLSCGVCWAEPLPPPPRTPIPTILKNRGSGTSIAARRDPSRGYADGECAG